MPSANPQSPTDPPAGTVRSFFSDSEDAVLPPTALTSPDGTTFFIPSALVASHDYPHDYFGGQIKEPTQFFEGTSPSPSAALTPHSHSPVASDTPTSPQSSPLPYASCNILSSSAMYGPSQLVVLPNGRMAMSPTLTPVMMIPYHLAYSVDSPFHGLFDTSSLPWHIKPYLAPGSSHSAPQRNRRLSYKTILCRNYVRDGFCRYGDSCQFIHSSDLRFKTPGSQPQTLPNDHHPGPAALWPIRPDKTPSRAIPVAEPDHKRRARRLPPPLDLSACFYGELDSIPIVRTSARERRASESSIPRGRMLPLRTSFTPGPSHGPSFDTATTSYRRRVNSFNEGRGKRPSISASPLTPRAESPAQTTPDEVLVAPPSTPSPVYPTAIEEGANPLGLALDAIGTKLLCPAVGTASTRADVEQRLGDLDENAVRRACTVDVVGVPLDDDSGKAVGEHGRGGDASLATTRQYCGELVDARRSPTLAGSFRCSLSSNFHASPRALPDTVPSSPRHSTTPTPLSPPALESGTSMAPKYEAGSPKPSFYIDANGAIVYPTARVLGGGAKFGEMKRKKKTGSRRPSAECHITPWQTPPLGRPVSYLTPPIAGQYQLPFGVWAVDGGAASRGTIYVPGTAVYPNMRTASHATIASSPFDPHTALLGAY